MLYVVQHGCLNDSVVFGEKVSLQVSSESCGNEIRLMERERAYKKLVTFL